MVTSSSFNTETDDINVFFGNQAAEYEYKYKIDFDNTKWKAKLVGFEIHASQDYTPIFGEVKLKTTFNYAGKSMTNLLTWGTFDSGDSKLGENIFTATTGTSGQNLSVNLLYTIPQIAITPKLCSFSVQTTVVFESIVSDPGPGPDIQLPPSEVVQDGSDPPDFNFDFFGLKIDPKWVLLGGGLLAAVLIARPSAPVTILKEIRR